MTSNMIYIVALGVGFKCPHKINLNTQCSVVFRVNVNITNHGCDKIMCSMEIPAHSFSYGNLKVLWTIYGPSSFLPKTSNVFVIYPTLMDKVSGHVFLL